LKPRKIEKLYSEREKRLLADLERKQKVAKRKETASKTAQTDKLDSPNEAVSPIPKEITQPEPEEILDDGPEILWQPNKEPNRWHEEGPQIAYLKASEDEVLFAGGRGPLAYGELVLTPGGFKPVEQIVVGSKVVCPDNSIAEVIRIPFDGLDECFEFEFIDGRKVITGHDHLWNIEVSNRTLKPGSKRNRLRTTEWIVAHFEKNVRNATKKDIRHILIPLPDALRVSQYQDKFDIDPYLLGLLLGDGCLRSGVKLTTYDDEIVNFVSGQHAISFNGKDINFLKCRVLVDKLRTLKLYNKLAADKFIPACYKKGSIEARKAILQGLMDTDGTVDKLGHASFCSVSKRLAEDVQWLVRSLGGKATITGKDPFYYDNDRNKVRGQKAYILYIQISKTSELFRLKRKKDRCTDSFNGGHTEPKLRLVNVKPVGIKQCRCITIDDTRGLFITNDFIVTHNSGKSSAMLADVIQWVHVPRFRALIIRRTFPELRDLINRAQELYLKLYPAAKWKEQEKLFIFPSGAKIEFGYCDSMNDLLRYQGQEYHWLGVDEISQFESPEYYIKLKMSVRHPPKGVPKKFYRSTTNPSGPGVNWVKDYWINNALPGQKFTKEFDTPVGKQTISYKWIQSLPGDNTFLMENDPSYITQLSSIENEMQRRQWLEGDWDAIEGLAFDEFRKNKDGKEWHVVTPFEIPGSWYKFRACDWGYSSMAVCLWFAVDPDNNVYIYREYVTKQTDAPDFAREVLQREAGEAIAYGIIDGSVGDQRGHNGPSIDEQMREVGIRWRYADKSPGSRKSSKMMVHNYLKTDEFVDAPKLRIFKNCNELIREMTSLCLDENDTEQVNTKMCDHAYDALRYGLMSRPMQSKYYFDWTGGITNMRPIAVNPKFGY